MSTKLSKCCVSGHWHKGVAKGSVEDIEGINAYVTGTNKSKTLLAITDIFGYELNNVRLLADEYATTGGYRVVVPDFFDNDFVPISHMKVLTPLHTDPVPEAADKEAKTNAAFADVGPWLERQKDDVVQPRFSKVIAALKADSAEKLGVVGFCWGGRQALLLARTDSQVDVVAANHPSFTEFPAAFEAVAKPTLIQVGDNDSMFPPDQVKTVKEEIFPKKKDAELIVYAGAVHGFTVRGDQNDAAELKLKEDSANAALSFFAKHL